MGDIFISQLRVPKCTRRPFADQKEIFQAGFSFGASHLASGRDMKKHIANEFPLGLFSPFH